MMPRGEATGRREASLAEQPERVLTALADMNHLIVGKTDAHDAQL
jgi:hypothetical protein